MVIGTAKELPVVAGVPVTVGKGHDASLAMHHQVVQLVADALEAVPAHSQQQYPQAEDHAQQDGDEMPVVHAPS